MNKKIWWMICYIGMLLITAFWAALTSMAPKYMVRTILPVNTYMGGRYVVCRYIPGEYKDVEVVKGAQIQSTQAENYKEGNIVKIKIKMNADEEISKIKIYYTIDRVFLGPEEDIPDNIYEQELDGYLPTGAINLGDGQIGMWEEYFYAAVKSATIALLLPVMLKLFSWSRKKKEQEEQEELSRKITEYLETRWDSDKYRMREKWMAGEIRKINLGVILNLWFLIACIEALFVWIKAWILAILLVLVLAFACFIIRAIQFIKLERKFAQIPDDGGDKLEIIWCFSQLHDESKFWWTQWGVLDMGAAEMMTDMKDYAESYSFAKLLWSSNKKERTKGISYLQYHFLQYRNCRHLKLEEAEEHLECVNQEINRDPDSKYAKVVKEKLNESESDKENEIGN